MFKRFLARLTPTLNALFLHLKKFKIKHLLRALCRMIKLRTEEQIMQSWQGDTARPLVSICCITYNHEPYIEDALEGFLIQETDFPFEILIHDDASTDRTAEIIREYEAKYPTLIKPIYQTENQYSKGMRINPIFNYPRAHGKYIATCEGDDYWTDLFKLKKQVCFLENNPTYSMCSHSVKFVFDGIVEKRTNYSETPVVDASFEEILERGMFIAFNSIVFRKKIVSKAPRMGT